MRILSEAVKDMALDWSPPEQPAKNRMDVISATGPWKSTPSLPLKPCCAIVHIAEKAYMAAGQAAFCHSYYDGAASLQSEEAAALKARVYLIFYIPLHLVHS